MQLRTILAIALVAGVFAACNGKNKIKEQTENHDMATHEHVEEEKGAANPTFNNDKLNMVYQHYIHLKNALVASEVNEAKNASASLKTAITELNDKDATAVAEKLANSSTIEEQRAVLNDLSKNVERLIKSSGVKSGEVYLEFCPMANNNDGGYWLSNEKEIKNPYFGDKMMKCGSVEETLVKK
ncbi:DUF3347 domain-containing protein [Solitalea koreensis]|uniref:DUF3347 domain-containing protein n=1 Tax=Solitalea koreensis TaxID=543615 RepID=A0A521DB60_9SPHI|nr:DUF3347 domain-containing protein [Solitalea koreensis]SMO68957.1 Protein of unknown function [Solitalea koreensis]